MQEKGERRKEASGGREGHHTTESQTKCHGTTEENITYSGGKISKFKFVTVLGI